MEEKAVKTYSFTATIEKVEGIDGAFVQVPLDLPKAFGAGSIKVHAAIGKDRGVFP